MKGTYAIGVDLGGTKVKLGIVTSSGKIVKKLSVPTFANEGVEKSISQIIQGIKKLIKGKKKILLALVSDLLE